MMKTLLAGTVAGLLAFSTAAIAGPVDLSNVRVNMHGAKLAPPGGFACNAGAASSLWLGAAALGLTLRRRR